MARGDWLSGSRGELAADRILDAAGQLFARQSPASVGMNDIARAAGCSRATLYRYFDSREALHAGYVHRQARLVHAQLGAQLAGIDDPRRRLVDGFCHTLQLVRADPALRSWFGADAPPLGAELAGRSEVITTLVAAFLSSLDGTSLDGAESTAERRARWLVRALTSLLSFPGTGPEDERAMVQEFLVPVLLPASAQPGPRHPGKSVPG
ncbi:TetR/AcrR family transcriptional regulator [Mycolicibacterium fallax]|uniref:TetR family transcriptional regulator n=1 Tax=Mycolicibacterium fallax TaxID=1793 RepID=A0A1X1R7N9_MYCFA|nr:TetR/AcrR family transcriptional regulator [Mycolicibacterium fallax]ORV00917.1 TetR family transcriptional regulator [Mycolicibacterium fallax]BBZ00462.1 putative HTH-type transcriptional regulator [Mycolicibacterium fallax]